MRIGIDGRLVYYHQAGIGQYILNLTEALALGSDGDEFFLFQSRKDRTRFVSRTNLKLRRLWTPSHHRFERLALAVEFFPHHLDLLHSPDFIPPQGLRFPSVITIHDLAFLLYPRILTDDSARYYGQMDSAWRDANHVIVPSLSTKRDTVRLLGVPEEKITVIYEAANRVFYPLDRAEAREHVQRKYGLERDFILFVGTIEPRKNITTLLQAYRKLLDAYKLDVSLVIAGGRGWLSNEVYELANELRLAEKVRFLGGVSSEELAFLYNAARVFAFPSQYEGFGLPPLEAMACRTPVIVSNNSSLPEVVGDAGLLVTPQDVDAWAASLARMLSDEKLWQECAEKGYRRSMTFSWQRAARETLEVYRHIVKR